MCTVMRRNVVDRVHAMVGGAQVVLLVKMVQYFVEKCSEIMFSVLILRVNPYSLKISFNSSKVFITKL